jgi:hypothetical protein
MYHTTYAPSAQLMGPPGGGHFPSYGGAAAYNSYYGGVDLWPQLRPRLKELLAQFNKDQRVAEQACKTAQDLVRGLHTPSELQHVLSEVLYDLRRLHPQIRKLRFRVASSAVQDNPAQITGPTTDMVMKQVLSSIDQERQTNLAELANLLQNVARALATRAPDRGYDDEPEDLHVSINRELITPLMKLAVSTPGPLGKPKASAAAYLLNNVLSELLKSCVPRDVMPLGKEVLKNMLDMMNAGFLSLEIVEVFFIVRQLVDVLGSDIPGPLVRKLVKTCMKAVKSKADGPWQCRRQAIRTISALINTMQVVIHTDYPDLEFQMSPAGQELMHLKLNLIAFFDECRFDKSMQVKEEAAKAKDELNLIPDRDIDLD